MAEKSASASNSVEAETTESLFAKEISTCQSCKESLKNRDSSLLVCLHPFCNQCLENLIDAAEQASSTHGLAAGKIN